MENIAFYVNSYEFGGHEKLGLEFINALSLNNSVYVYCSEFNTTLIKNLQSLKCIIRTFPYKCNRIQIIKNFFSFSHRKLLLTWMKKDKISLCILLQGNIEISYLAYYPCNKLSIPCISYIPNTHFLHDVSKYKFIGNIKDLFQKKLYQKIQNYITISSVAKENILKRNKDANVSIISNPVDVNTLNTIRAKRMLHKLNKEHINVLYVGRYSYWHKGLDSFINFLNQYLYKMNNFEFYFIGDGEAKSEIDKLVKTHPNVHNLGWKKDPLPYYIDADVLIMPSRFEGVSLTMLDALFLNIPIVANNIKEFAEWIPQEYLFELDNPESIYTKLNHFYENSSVVKTTREFLSYQDFRNNVVKTLYLLQTQ